MDYLFGPMSFVPIKNHEWNTSADIANESTNGLVSLGPKETPSQHIQTYDFPANRDWLELQAQATGWSFHWAWTGRHNAEAVALLQPI